MTNPTAREALEDLMRLADKYADAAAADQRLYAPAARAAAKINLFEALRATLSHQTAELEALRKDAERKLTDDDVQWVVNDIAELGVKIGSQFFFLYKGRSLVYGEHNDSRKDGFATHDDGSPMHWRPVFKREFGECCHPVNYEDLRKCGHPHYIGTVNLSDSEEWKPLPAPPDAAIAAAPTQEGA
jgi:hypothetical protein